MTVFVDRLTHYGGSATFRWAWSCHMYGDDLEELHAFARRIGLKRAWFQGPPKHDRLPHYDLNASRRVAAVRAGAVEHDRSAMVALMRARPWDRHADDEARRDLT